MGLWSLLPSWLSTVLDAILERSLVAKARSGVVLLSHRLEKKVGGSLGSFRRTRPLSTCQSSTSSPLRSASSQPHASE